MDRNTENDLRNARQLVFAGLMLIAFAVVFLGYVMLREGQMERDREDYRYFNRQMDRNVSSVR